MIAQPERASSVVLAAAILLFTGSAGRSLMPPDVAPTALTTASPQPVDVRISSPLSASDKDVELAIDANPFSRERQRPAARFGEFIMNVSPAVNARPDIRNVRLLGTTVAGAQSFALVEQPDRPLTMLRLNDEFLGFKVSKIDRGKMILVTRDSTVVFELKKGQ